MSQAKYILIAEDEADMAQLLAHHLRRQGYRTAIATDGLAALNSALEQRPDLLVLDWMLPNLNGLEICRLVKNSPTLKNMPVLMVTAMASTEHKLEGFRNGADDYLSKPFDVRELVARVQSLLHRAQQVAA